jgi:hypothetical protein
MNSANQKSPPAKRRVFLFFFFLVPSLLCLGFYYFGIRRPFTEGGKIFKPLPHLGKFKGTSSNGDSLFEPVSHFIIQDLNRQYIHQDELQNKFYLLSFVDDTCSKDCKAVLFQLSRAQEKLHYLRKSFQIVTMVKSNSTEGIKRLDDLHKAVHPDAEIWKMGIYSDNPDTLINQNLRINMLPKLARCTHPVPSEWAVLVDRDHQARAYYRIIDVKETDRMITEALVLSAEYGKFKNMDLKKQ